MFEVSEAVVQRGSRPEVLCTKGVLKNFAKFTGKHLCQILRQILARVLVADLRLATLLKKTQAQVFSFGFCEMFKSTFFNRTSPVAASEIYFSSQQ